MTEGSWEGGEGISEEGFGVHRVMVRGGGGWGVSRSHRERQWVVERG
jgi:hypothetical protein